MDDSASIIRGARAFQVRPHTLVPSGIKLDDPSRLVLGNGATVDGGVFLAGSLYTQRGVRVHGPIRVRGDVILGAGSRVAYGVAAEGEVRCMPDVLVDGDIESGADVHLYQGTKVRGCVQSKGDIVVHGEAEAQRMESAGRVRMEPFVESEALPEEPAEGRSEAGDSLRRPPPDKSDGDRGHERARHDVARGGRGDERSG